MASLSAGKQIGRLNIRVLPDATRFRHDLKKSLDRIEKSMEVHIGVRADTRQAELELVRFRSAESGKAISINAAVNTAAARAQMMGLSRPRFVALHARINEASFKKASALIGQLTGFRVARSVLTDVSDALQNIDLNVPKIARVALAIGSLTAMTIVASAGLITLTGDLAKMANVGLVLPAAFTGMAVGIITLAMALKDSKTQLAELGPAFTRLQDIISNNFWAEAKKPIIDFVNSVLPQAREGFALTATALGNQAAAIAGAFQTTFANGVLLGMFQKLGETIDIVTGGSRAFAETLTTLGVVGSSYLPRLAEWVVKIGDSFNTWVQGAAATGMLDKYIEDGITSIKLFGESIDGIVGIFRGLDSAATAAGGGGLTAFAANMQGAAAIIQSPAVQAALTSIIQGASLGMAGIGKGMESVGQMLMNLAPQIHDIFITSGEAIGGFLTAVSEAMTQPAFKDGLTGFFDGIAAGVAALGPAMGPLFAFIGTLGGVLGTLATQVGEVLAAIKITFAPVLDEMLKAIEPLIPAIGEQLTGAIEFLGPLMEGIGTFIAENNGLVQGAVVAFVGLAAAFKIGGAAIAIVKGIQLGYTAATYGGVAATYAAGAASKIGAAAHYIMAAATAVVSGSLYTQVAAWVAQTGAQIASRAQAVLVGAAWLTNIVGQGIKVLASLAVQTGAWIANTAAQVAQKAVLIGGAAAMGIATAATWLLNAALSANPIAIVVIAIAALVAGLIWFFTQTELGQEIWANFTQFLGEAWANISKVATDVFTNLGTFFSDVWNGIVTFFTDAIAVIMDLFFTWHPLGVIIANWDAIVQFFVDVWANIVQFVTDGITTVLTVLTDIGTGISEWWNGMWEGVFTFLSDVWNNIVAWIGEVLTVLMDLFFTWHPLGVIIANWEGIVQFFTDIWNNVVAFVTEAIGKVLAIVTDVGTGISTAWNNMWTGISTFVSTIWNNIVRFISDAIEKAKATIDRVMSAVNTAWSRTWATITGVVSGVWTSVSGFIGQITGGISNMIGTIGTTLAGIPGTVMGAFGNVGKWLFNSGKSIIQGLIDGVNNMIGAAKRAASGVMSAIRNFFPFSPAKEGPFSGRGWTLYSGRSMGEALADGMDDTVSTVRRSALAMMGAATVSGSASLNDVEFASTAATSGSGSQVNLTVNNPISEPTSETIRRGAQLIGAALV